MIDAEVRHAFNHDERIEISAFRKHTNFDRRDTGVWSSTLLRRYQAARIFIVLRGGSAGNSLRATTITNNARHFRAEVQC
jgi:hypothetical protein